MHDDHIAHYGVKRRSGRYPWGSGGEPYQRGSNVSINGIARSLNDRDLVGASKSLGISNKTISSVKNNPDSKLVQEAMFGPSFYNSPGRPVIGSGPIPSKDKKPENVSRNLTWDEDKKMWRAAGTVAYWDYSSGSWIVEGDSPYSHIYFNQIWDRWETEDGKIVSINSQYEQSPGERYRPEGIPEDAVWNQHRNCWEINVPEHKPKIWNPEKGEWEIYDPSQLLKSMNNDRDTPLPEDNTIVGYEKKKGWLGKLQSALAKMGSFFKRKISEIIDKFDD